MTLVRTLLVRLERRRSTLFLTGAAALLVLAGLFAVEAMTDRVIEHRLVLGTAWTIVFLGYLGLYPALADDDGWLARAAGFFAGVGALGFGIIVLSSALDLTGLAPFETRPAWFGVLAVLPLIGINVGPLLYGVSSLRTRVFPRSMGYLLLVPSLIYYVNIGRAVLRPGPTDPAVTTVLVMGYTVAMFGVGYLLRTTSGYRGDAASSPESAA